MLKSNVAKEAAFGEGEHGHSLVTSLIAADLGKRKHCFEMDPGGTLHQGSFWLHRWICAQI